MFKKMPMLKFALGFAGLMLAAGPASAQAVCTAPTAPAKVDGATVTQQQLSAAIGEVKAFIAASDVYQDCLGKDLEAQKAEAIKNKTPFSATIQEGVMAKVAANQTQKEKVGQEINASITVYKKAHP